MGSVRETSRESVRQRNDIISLIVIRDTIRVSGGTICMKKLNAVSELKHKDHSVESKLLNT